VVTWHEVYLAEQIFLLIIVAESTVTHFSWWQRLSAESHRGPFRFHILGKAINGVGLTALLAILILARMMDREPSGWEIASALMIFIIGYCVMLSSTWIIELNRKPSVIAAGFGARALVSAGAALLLKAMGL
jgi:CHASE2 domain-containing sensor protein